MENWRKISCETNNDSGTLPPQKGNESMKYLGNTLVLILLLSLGAVKAQSCGGKNTMWAFPGAKPTFLGLIVGSYDRPDAGTWKFLLDQNQTSANDPVGPKAVLYLAAGKAEQALKIMEPLLAIVATDSALDSAASLTRVADLEVGAIAALVAGKLDLAAVSLAQASTFKTAPDFCRIRTEKLVVRYLLQYGMEAPIFPHFNSGFYNYIQDDLSWDPKHPDEDGYILALNTVAMLYRLDSKRQSLYLELLGDLLSKEPSHFNANYMAALAYLRAGQIIGGNAEQEFDRKALFALEAPRQSEIRFNLYRFTQLKKALEVDADSAVSQQAVFAVLEAKAIAAGTDPLARFQGKFNRALTTSAFEVQDPGHLAAILTKSKAQIAAREGESKRYAGDIDLKKAVKKDSRFNAFALFLIGTIVVALVFIWRKLRIASKPQS